MPAPGFEDYGVPTSYSGESINGMNVGSSSQEQPIKARQYGYQGPDVSLEDLGWRTINGPFISVWLHNVPWGGEDTLAAPDAKVSLFCQFGFASPFPFSSPFFCGLLFVFAINALGASSRFNPDLVMCTGKIKWN